MAIQMKNLNLCHIVQEKHKLLIAIILVFQFELKHLKNMSVISIEYLLELTPPCKVEKREKETRFRQLFCVDC